MGKLSTGWTASLPERSVVPCFGGNDLRRVILRTHTRVITALVIAARLLLIIKGVAGLAAFGHP